MNTEAFLTHSTTAPSFYVREIPIYGDAILSPMDGYSDLPFRAVCRALGSAMSYTEFVNVDDLLQRAPFVDKKLAYREDERPIVYQLYGDDPARILEAALRVRDRDPDLIDINMGCPAKSISNRGAGVGLMRTPEKIAEIFRLLTSRLDLPITGKIRLGWDDDSLTYMEVARLVEDNGGSLLAVHGRTKQMGYGGQARWDPIAEIVGALSIPVIGNGDVTTPAGIQRMKDYTGCAGVMIARAAISNPWIFAGYEREAVPPELARETMLRHLQLNLDFYGPERGLVLFRKFAAQYLSPLRLSRELRQRLLTSTEAFEFVDLLENIIGAHQVTLHPII